MIQEEAVILVVEDELSQQKALSAFLRKKNYQIAVAGDLAQALHQFESQTVDLVLSDIRLPDGSGEEVLEQVKRIRPDVPVILMTAYGNTAQAVHAMRNGAADYITKPLDLNELDLILHRELERSLLLSENRRLKEMMGDRRRATGMISQSPAMQEVLNTALRAASSEASILILGESGTGKEVLARAIHATSARAEKPFVPIHCAALPEGLIQSELFGHEKGAFTGANHRREGRFEMAHQGTVFIDEVGDIPLPLQVQLLRVLQERTFERLGGSQSISVDVRILAATHRHLLQAIQDGTFREDLYYRLGVITVEIPPLRERREDIPPLITHFLHRYAPGRDVEVSREAMDLLMKYHWPGNVRELENVIERAVVLSRNDWISTRDLPPNLRTLRPEPQKQNRSLPELVEDLEKTLIRQALLDAKGNQSQAARILGITERNLRYKIKKYGSSEEHDLEYDNLGES